MKIGNFVIVYRMLINLGFHAITITLIYNGYVHNLDVVYIEGHVSSL